VSVSGALGPRVLSDSAESSSGFLIYHAPVSATLL
jgi:hypothetical protein